MLLYAVIIRSTHSSEEHQYIDALNQLNIAAIVVQNSSQALHMLSQENHLVHLILIESSLLENEPLFISQLRMHHQYRHIAVAIYHTHNSITQNSGHGFHITQPEDLKPLLPALQEYAAKNIKMKFDLGVIKQADFKFRTLEQGYLLAQFLSHQFPDSNQCLVGITELFINAVEHGNLQISYEDKSALLASGRWTEEVEQRLEHPDYKNRTVSVSFSKNAERIELFIEDQGQGFQWENFETIDPRRMLASHGRGIMMAKSLSFSSLSYEGKGNQVRATLVLEQPTEKKV